MHVTYRDTIHKRNGGAANNEQTYMSMSRPGRVPSLFPRYWYPFLVTR